MILLKTDTPEFYGDICEVVRLFLGPVEIRMDGGERLLTHTHETADGQWVERFSMDGETGEATQAVVTGGLVEKRLLKRAVKTACYRLMKRLTGMQPPWGSLTGIRPTRLMYELAEEGITGEAAERELQRRFDVSADKARLLSDILAMQKGVIDPPEDTFDLYIGIPFCTTR